MLELTSPAPTLTMYSVAVELSDCTGCTDSWLEKAPKLAKSTLVNPASISALLRAQYWSPR